MYVKVIRILLSFHPSVAVHNPAIPHPSDPWESVHLIHQVVTRPTQKNLRMLQYMKRQLLLINYYLLLIIIKSRLTENMWQTKASLQIYIFIHFFFKTFLSELVKQTVL